jgi:hypothetical protein
MGLANEVLSIYSETKARWIVPIARGFALDSDALAWIDAVIAAGGTLFASESATRRLVSDFFTALKTDGTGNLYEKIGRIYFPVWQVAAANAICAKSLTSGTFVGTVTHGEGFVQGDGSTGYFDTGVSAPTLGMTASSAWHGFLAKVASSLDPTVVMGARTSASSVINFSRSGSDLRTTFGNDGLLSSALTVAHGIISANRNATNRAMYQRLSGGRTQIAADSTAANGSLPAITLNYMNFNRTDGAPVYSNAEFGSVFLGNQYVPTEQDEAFTLILKDFYESLTGITLP